MCVFTRVAKQTVVSRCPPRRSTVGHLFGMALWHFGSGGRVLARCPVVRRHVYAPCGDLAI